MIPLLPWRQFSIQVITVSNFLKICNERPCVRVALATEEKVIQCMIPVPKARQCLFRIDTQLLSGKWAHNYFCRGRDTLVIACFGQCPAIPLLLSLVAKFMGHPKTISFD